ncbi:MAG: hypothetical protein GXP55_21840 [Deltaproteobacteria bacterium]|nr:hypothetical protein [Deltaproteobacteria bacterium]
MRLLNLERRLLEATLAGFAPEGAATGLSPLPGEIDWGATFHGMADASNGQARLGMRAAIWLAGLAPVWLERRPRTLLSLSAEERVALLERLLSHRSFAVRELTLLLKLQAAFALLGSATARARSGYDRDRPAPVEHPDSRQRLTLVDSSARGGRS